VRVVRAGLTSGSGRVAILTGMSTIRETEASATPSTQAGEPARIGVAGVAGYGGSIIDELRRIGGELAVPAELAAVYEAFPERATERLGTLADAGVACHATYEALLNDPRVEAVWLPVPIHLHRPMSEAALRAGKAVMCEKPAAGCLADLDAMTAARDAAGLPLLIGFQEVYDPATRQLKRRLMDGVIGAVRRVSVCGCWPRPETYFQRNSWAGRREIDGVPSYDSPLANALAHFVNLALSFAAVDRLDDAAVLDDLDATLYRAHDIENFDTVTLAARTGAGVELQAWLTHACSETVQPVIQIDGDGGRVIRTLNEVRVQRTGQAEEVVPLVSRDRRPMFSALAATVRGVECPDRILATPELARAHTALVERLAGFPVATFPDELIEHRPAPDGKALRGVPGIEQRFIDAQANSAAPLDLIG